MGVTYGCSFTKVRGQRVNVGSGGVVSYGGGKVNGPSVVYANGSLIWKIKAGEVTTTHRTEGPSIYSVGSEMSLSYVCYSLNGEYLSHEEYIRRTLEKQV